MTPATLGFIATRYHQYCPVARALEIVGERWTLLIARELLLGPRRFTDLHTGLPGISTNVLTNRLKNLENAGLVTKRMLPSPAASVVYELAPGAAGLAGVLAAMAHWGTELLGAPRAGDEMRSAWLVLGLSVAAPVPVALASGVYELRVDTGDGNHEEFHIVVRDGHLQPKHGPATEPAGVVSMTESTLRSFAVGGLDRRDPAFAQLVTIAGDGDGAMALLDWMATAAAP